MIIIDVETTALGKTCCVLSIGAISFNPNGTIEELKDARKLHMHISLLQQIRDGRAFDEGTIKWLNGQPPAVVANAKKSATSKTSLDEACKRLISWLNETNGFDGNCHVRGVDFEGAILPDVAKQCKQRLPISFSGYNDIRTLIRDYLDTTSSYMAVSDMSEPAQEMMKGLEKHIAIDDCIIDAIQIIEGRRVRDERILSSQSKSNPDDVDEKLVRAAICKVLSLDPKDSQITLLGNDITTTQGAIKFITSMGGPELSACDFLDIVYG